jgi:parvulin-like peptidyl-prolyl isomerase
MMENTRRTGASIAIYLIFGLLILIFVINFGPQGGGRGGCHGTSNVVVSVNGEEATQTAYHIAYSTRYNEASGKQKTWLALEFLIRRELLAQEAESRGLLATDDMVDNEIKQGHFYFAGRQATIPGAIEDLQGEKFYNHKAVKAWANELNVSLNSYREEQKRSMLAAMMAQILEDSVVVSREEALNQFLFEGNTAVYDVVTFKPETYRSALKLTDADVDRFMATHAAEVEARYKADERTYKAVKPQLFLRQIMIAKPAAAGSGSAAAPDDGKAKLEAARAAIQSGKEKFADAAKQLNTDEAAKNAAGELGWRTADNPMLGDKALSDAVKGLKKGEMTPVVTTDHGAFLIVAEDRREGDLSFDQVKREIGKQLARDTWGKEAAKRAAIAALDHARNGIGMNLDQMYEKDKTEGPPPGLDLQKIINDPNLTDEQKQQILQQLLQQQQGGGGGDEGPHGALEVESTDTPAGWFADANGAGGGGSAGSTTKAEGSAAGSAATGAGSAATGAGSAVAAAGSGAGSAAAPAAPSTVSDANTPSKDQLPAMAEVEKAHVARFGPSPRSSTMPGLGASKEAQQAVYDDLQPGMLGKQVYEANGDYIILQLIQREKPNVAEFDKDADARVAQLRETRSRAFLNDWLKERCETLAKEDKIRANPELLADHDDQGRLLPTQYKPCISFR